jgi:hypothetical protein
MAKGLRSRSVRTVLDARRGRSKAQPMARSHPYNKLTFPVLVRSRHSRRTGARVNILPSPALPPCTGNVAEWVLCHE